MYSMGLLEIEKFHKTFQESTQKVKNTPDLSALIVV